MNKPASRRHRRTAGRRIEPDIPFPGNYARCCRSGIFFTLMILGPLARRAACAHGIDGAGLQGARRGPPPRRATSDQLPPVPRSGRRVTRLYNPDSNTSSAPHVAGPRICSAEQHWRADRPAVLPAAHLRGRFSTGLARRASRGRESSPCLIPAAAASLMRGGRLPSTPDSAARRFSRISELGS